MGEGRRLATFGCSFLSHICLLERQQTGRTWADLGRYLA